MVVGRTGWLWLDPATSIVIALVILFGAWALDAISFNLAFDATAPGIYPEAVKIYLAGLPGVTEVHDLHIWAMSTTETALTPIWCGPAPRSTRAARRSLRSIDKALRHPACDTEVEAGDAPTLPPGPAEVV